MQIFEITLDDLYLRNPWFKRTDLVCAVCEARIPTTKIWACDDSDLSTPGRMLCNVIYLCAICRLEEAKIRQELQAIATDYDQDDLEHAAGLRRMAESPLVRK